MDWPEYDIYEGNWKTLPLYSFGEKHEKFCKLCPITTFLIEEIPGLQTAAFSQMLAGTHITPHTGMTNRVLRYSLGVSQAKNCALRVGVETKTWESGEGLLFDDTTEHEAWNRGEESRVVLLIDFNVDPNENVEFPENLVNYVKTYFNENN